MAIIFKKILPIRELGNSSNIQGQATEFYFERNAFIPLPQSLYGKIHLNIFLISASNLFLGLFLVPRLLQFPTLPSSLIC
jgi:hypothetical protein